MYIRPRIWVDGSQFGFLVRAVGATGAFSLVEFRGLGFGFWVLLVVSPTGECTRISTRE